MVVVESSGSRRICPFSLRVSEAILAHNFALAPFIFEAIVAFVAI